jgi:hypothetical protein
VTLQDSRELLHEDFEKSNIATQNRISAVQHGSRAVVHQTEIRKALQTILFVRSSNVTFNSLESKIIYHISIYKHKKNEICLGS